MKSHYGIGTRRAALEGTSMQPETPAPTLRRYVRKQPLTGAARRALLAEVKLRIVERRNDAGGWDYVKTVLDTESRAMVRDLNRAAAEAGHQHKYRSKAMN